MVNSGAGYPADRLLRELATEYTHRYAASGINNQPVNFNYFEPFCEIGFLDATIAPYAKPAPELDHLFSFVDFLDYTTSDHSDGFALSRLLEIPEGRVSHFTANGDITELTFFTADGREFVVSGYSMVRHGSIVNWYIVGGAVFTADEWQALGEDEAKLDLENTPPWKRRFLQHAISLCGNERGKPVPLEGTITTQRTIVAGEIDLNSGKHLARCQMNEMDRVFEVVCDDPDVVDIVPDPTMREKILSHWKDRISSAAVLWSLGETMLQLPAYFAFNLNVATISVAGGKLIGSHKKGGAGLGGRFKAVSSIAVVPDPSIAVRAYTPAHYKTETSGHWRRLQPNARGKGPSGEIVIGRTWVKREAQWRDQVDRPRTIYVKSTIASARLKIKETLSRSVVIENSPKDEVRGVLYVMRCTLMEEEVYKVGWTSGTAEERRMELSSATGVPVSFAIVKYWQHSDARKLETNVHAILDPYRINDRREFFRLDYSALERIISAEIARTNPNE